MFAFEYSESRSKGPLSYVLSHIYLSRNTISLPLFLLFSLVVPRHIAKCHISRLNTMKAEAVMHPFASLKELRNRDVRMSCRPRAHYNTKQQRCSLSVPPPFCSSTFPKEEVACNVRFFSVLKPQRKYACLPMPLLKNHADTVDDLLPLLSHDKLVRQPPALGI
jgi:hypothetical protein